MFIFSCSDMKAFTLVTPFSLDIKGGEYLGLPFSLDVKGEEYLGIIWYMVAIKSKGGDCWHYGTSVVLNGNSQKIQYVSAKDYK